MVVLVPFDGSSQAREALDRAVAYGGALDVDVVAVSYVPTGLEYAERRRWVDPDENFPADSAASDLRRKIEEATDETELRYEDVIAQSPVGGLSREVRQTAADVDASVVFVATADDGQVTVPLGDDSEALDVFVVRRSE